MPATLEKEKLMKIIIIDDEEDIRELFSNFLEMSGSNQILTAATGKDAIALIERAKPEVVFLDIQLADNINGIEVLKVTREVSPGTRVVMMSSYLEEYGALTLSMGAFDFLKKPFNSDTLKAMVGKILG